MISSLSENLTYKDLKLAIKTTKLHNIKSHMYQNIKKKKNQPSTGTPNILFSYEISKINLSQNS